MKDEHIDKDKILHNEKQLNASTEELRVKLNALIDEHRLEPMDVLIVLSRISAGYIHLIEQAKPINMSPDEIEERFHFMVESHLADLDLYEIGKEMKKIDINAN